MRQQKKHSVVCKFILGFALPVGALVGPFFFFGCASIKKPDTDICVLNAPEKHQICYNVKKDFDDDGRIKAGAKPKIKPYAVLEDANKNICTDPEGWENMKAYVKKLREEYEKRSKDGKKNQLLPPGNEVP